MALFLVWHEPGRAIAPDLAAALDWFELRDGLMLVDSELELSPLYHRLKWALPAGTALCVAPPKFKRMEAGALAWLRARSERARKGGPKQGFG